MPMPVTVSSRHEPSWPTSAAHLSQITHKTVRGVALVGMTASAATAAQVAGSCSDYGDLANVALNIMLCLHTSVVRGAALGRWGTSFSCQADVLVVPYTIFAEASQDFLLSIAQSLHPFLHIVHHLLLNLTIVVVEIGVEPAAVSELSVITLPEKAYRHDSTSSVTWRTLIELSSHALTTRFTVWVYNKLNTGHDTTNLVEGTYKYDLAQISRRLVQDQVLRLKISRHSPRRNATCVRSDLY